MKCCKFLVIFLALVICVVSTPVKRQRRDGFGQFQGSPALQQGQPGHGGYPSMTYPQPQDTYQLNNGMSPNQAPVLSQNQGAIQPNPQLQGAFQETPQAQGAFQQPPQPQGAFQQNPQPQGAFQQNPQPQGAFQQNPQPQGVFPPNINPQTGFQPAQNSAGIEGPQLSSLQPASGNSPPQPAPGLTAQSTSNDPSPGTLSPKTAAPMPQSKPDPVSRSAPASEAVPKPTTVQTSEIKENKEIQKGAENTNSQKPASSVPTISAKAGDTSLSKILGDFDPYKNPEDIFKNKEVPPPKKQGPDFSIKGLLNSFENIVEIGTAMVEDVVEDIKEGAHTSVFDTIKNVSHDIFEGIKDLGEELKE